MKRYSLQEKEVLILGGGDGGLLKELLELPQPPKFVTMVDIDDVVMDACTEFMPTVAGDYMRRGNRDGKNYKVIAGCAIKFLKEKLVGNTFNLFIFFCIITLHISYQASDKQYDYIFGDLTDTPVSTSDRDNGIWDFLKSIIGMGVQGRKNMTNCLCL